MNIAIIGGGAAGMMATATIAEASSDHEILLFDKNDGFGKKVIISGGGRCNVTTGIRDIRTVLTKYPRGNKFLTTAMHQFSPEKVYQWFESHGVPLKIEDDLRVFPQSNHGEDIVQVFENIFHKHHVSIRLRSLVDRIQKSPKGFEIYFKLDTKPVVVDRLILTTGGQAYRQTGSTGDGYAFATELGHTITKLAPSLNSFTTREPWTAEVSGLSFESATITANLKGHPHITGPFLFTHKGVSGPAVFALSSMIAHETYDQSSPLEIHIDLFPKENQEQFRINFERVIQQNLKKSVLNILSLFLPKSLSEMCCVNTHIPTEKHSAELSKLEIRQIVSWMKGIPLNVIGRGAGDEFVTAGGVSLSEVNPRTMESLICPGLYFAGEILDIDGFTGGFNLQASWATGHLAGASLLVAPK